MTRTGGNTKRIGLSKGRFIMMMTVMVVVWALAFPFIKIGLEELSFINLTIMRLFVVCSAFILLIVLQSKKFTKLHKRDIPSIFILGFFGVMIYHLGINYGEQYVSAGATSLIIATIPVFIVILAAAFLNEVITAKKLVGIIISMGGVVILSIWGRKDTSIEIEYIYGAFAVLMAAIMGAFYTVAGKRLLRRYSAHSLTAYAMLLGSVGALPLLNASFFEEAAALSTEGWCAVIFLGLFSTVIGYILWYKALEIKTATEVSVYLYFIPILSTLFSYLLFEDNITLLFVFGGALVLLGVVIVNLSNNTE